MIFLPLWPVSLQTSIPVGCKGTALFGEERARNDSVSRRRLRGQAAVGRCSVKRRQAEAHAPAPVFVAQHAKATRCRGCLAKWHQIARGRQLTAEQAHVVEAIRGWLCENCEVQDWGMSSVRFRAPANSSPCGLSDGFPGVLGCGFFQRAGHWVRDQVPVIGGLVYRFACQKFRASLPRQAGQLPVVDRINGRGGFPGDCRVTSPEIGNSCHIRKPPPFRLIPGRIVLFSKRMRNELQWDELADQIEVETADMEYPDSLRVSILPE